MLTELKERLEELERMVVAKTDEFRENFDLGEVEVLGLMRLHIAYLQADILEFERACYRHKILLTK